MGFDQVHTQLSLTHQAGGESINEALQENILERICPTLDSLERRVAAVEKLV